jgi:hypothetical protein
VAKFLNGIEAFGRRAKSTLSKIKSAWLKGCYFFLILVRRLQESNET